MSTPNPAIKGPGVLYVTSRIARDDILDEDTFFKWYDEDHIDEIVNTSGKIGMRSAFRYRDVDIEEKQKRKEKIYLAFYPMEDLAFTQGDEFRGIRVKSPILPESGIIYDLADLDVRYNGLVHKVQSKNRPDAGAPCLIIFGVEPGHNLSDGEVEKWFRDEHFPAAAAINGHIRSTLYHLQYARTNAQSRALKGLPTTDTPAPEPPTWLAMHEFEEVISIPPELENTPNAQKVVQGAKQIERVVYRLAKALGTKWFFDY